MVNGNSVDDGRFMEDIFTEVKVDVLLREGRLEVASGAGCG